MTIHCKRAVARLLWLQATALPPCVQHDSWTSLTYTWWACMWLAWQPWLTDSFHCILIGRLKLVLHLTHLDSCTGLTEIRGVFVRVARPTALMDGLTGSLEPPVDNVALSVKDGIPLCSRSSGCKADQKSQIWLFFEILASTTSSALVWLRWSHANIPTARNACGSATVWTEVNYYIL